MKLIFKDGTGIELKEGEDANRYLANREVATIPGEIKEAFLEHNYDLNGVNGSFTKIFTMNSKELSVLKNNLVEIDSMGLKDIFNGNLDFRVFTRNFINKVKECLQKGIPFLNPDNTFANHLITGEEYEVKTNASNVSTPKVEAVNPSVSPLDLMSKEYSENKEYTGNKELDNEDIAVKEDLLKNLLKLREECNDGTLKFIITSAIANIDTAIANDNKLYKVEGTRHLIEKAMNGVPITADMEEDINSILAMFPGKNERGQAR